MEKSEIECCGTTHLHDSLVHQIEDGMPKEETIRELSDFFKVFGDMTRIKILCVLFQAELCVCDLAEVVGMTQSAVSHQLRILKQMKLVKIEEKERRYFTRWQTGIYRDLESGNGAYNRVEAV